MKLFIATLAIGINLFSSIGFCELDSKKEKSGIEQANAENKDIEDMFNSAHYGAKEFIPYGHNGSYCKSNATCPSGSECLGYEAGKLMGNCFCYKFKSGCE